MAEATRRTTRRRRQPAPTQHPFVLPNWTVDVADFGRISRGSIKMAPLVVLVGRNNTGKSYIASLLWALLNAEDRAFQGIGSSQKRLPQWMRDLVLAASDSETAIKKILTKAEVNSICEYMAHNICADASEVFPKLFSVKEMKPPKIKLHFEDFEDAIISINIKRNDHDRPFLSMEWHEEASKLTLDAAVSIGRDRALGSLLARFMVDSLASALMRGRIPRARGSVQYIPAARTGLMLAYRPLVSTLLDTLGFETEFQGQTSLPLPTIRFLQALTTKEGTTSKKVLTQIAKDLEQGILGGKIAASRAQIPDFTYHPSHHEAALPLHIASSMITELAPFLLLLKSGQGAEGIIFEEPEAHLHIDAQRKMALAIARLVNAGVRVVITTHSDTFLQQINNLMQLYGHAKRDELLEKFAYSQNDLINPEWARAYEFIPGDNGTEIVEAARVEEGFIVPSLNETLASLATETFSMQSED